MKRLTPSEIRSVIAEKVPPGRVVPEHTETAHFYRDSVSGNKYASVTTKSGILEAEHLKKWAARMAVEFILEKVSGTEHVRVQELVEMRDQAIFAHQDKFEDAGGVGTQGHAIVENYINHWLATGSKPESILPFIEAHPSKGNDTRLHAIARSAEKFFNDYYVEPIASELLVASNKYGFAGTLDALGMMGFIKKLNDKDCVHTFLLASRSRQKYECVQCGTVMVKEFCLLDWKCTNSIDKIDYAMQTSAYYQALKEMTGLKPQRIFVIRLSKEKAQYEVRELVNRPLAFRCFRNLANVYDMLTPMKDSLSVYPKKARVSLDTLPSSFSEVL